MSLSPTLPQRLLAGGLHVDLSTCDNIIVPATYLHSFTGVRGRQLRPDDILLVSYPKSDTHWVWEILKIVVAGGSEYAQHIKYGFMPECLWELKCKIIYLERNAKDVAVSYHNQSVKQSWPTSNRPGPTYTGTWADFVDFFLEGVPFCSWFDHVINWKQVPDVHPKADICFVKYEDMKQDCFKAVKMMAEYLGRPQPDVIYSDIVDACSFHKLKHASNNTKDQTFHKKWEDDSAGYFRKGEVGDWKNWFTVAQSDKFDRVYRHRMKQDFPY